MKKQMPVDEQIPQTPSQVIGSEPIVLPEPTWIVTGLSAEQLLASLEHPVRRIKAAKFLGEAPEGKEIQVISRMLRYLVADGVLYVPNDLADLPMFAKQKKVVVDDFTAIFEAN